MQQQDLEGKKMTSLHKSEWLNFFNWSDRLRRKPSKCPEVGSIAVMAFFVKLLRICFLSCGVKGDLCRGARLVGKEGRLIEMLWIEGGPLSNQCARQVGGELSKRRF